MPASVDITRRKDRRGGPPHLPVGDLRAHADDLAAEVQKAFTDGEHLVWADSNQTVYVSRGVPPEVPDHWIIGNYMMGASGRAIAQDLSAKWSDRSKNFVID
jgi:hypothetical protein